MQSGQVHIKPKLTNEDIVLSHNKIKQRNLQTPGLFSNKISCFDIKFAVVSLKERLSFTKGIGPPPPPWVRGQECAVELKSLHYRHVLYFLKRQGARVSEIMFRRPPRPLGT